MEYKDNNMIPVKNIYKFLLPYSSSGFSFRDLKKKESQVLSRCAHISDINWLNSIINSGFDLENAPIVFLYFPLIKPLMKYA